MSSSVVFQALTLTRIAARPCQTPRTGIPQQRWAPGQILLNPTSVIVTLPH